jgi:hypothetical protein
MALRTVRTSRLHHADVRASDVAHVGLDAPLILTDEPVPSTIIAVDERSQPAVAPPL